MNTKSIQRTVAAIVSAVAIAAVSPLFAEEHDHDHGGAKAGPNGGRVLHKVEPHIEFFVMKDRKVKLTVLNDKLEATPLGGQVVSVTAGDRSKPVRMTFSKAGDSLVSDIAFPEGDDFPVVVQIKNKGAKTVIEKFTMDFSPCPTCEHLEYACTCDHSHDHDHDEKKK